MKVILIVVMFISPFIIFTEGAHEEWVAQYDGPNSYWDESNGVAYDIEGNAYVTGMSEGYNTIKYDRNGNIVWGVTDSIGARDIEVDNEGYVYITGIGGTQETYVDYYTIKYDSDGKKIWSARYNGPGNFYDRANDLSIDKDGNVYVTGDSDGFYADNADYCTIKYDSNGKEQWVARYDSPYKDDDLSWDIVVDTFGNSYVTGYSYVRSGTIDYCTIKYDTNGNQKWVARYNGQKNKVNTPYDIAIDNNGYVYVTGECDSNCDDQGDYCTIKYDSNGNQLWVAKYDGLTNKRDTAYSIDVDQEGNVYVTGNSCGTGPYGDICTIKYDKDGNEMWVVRIDDGNGIDLTFRDGFIYVGGNKGFSSDADFITIKYNTDGKQLWMITYDVEGSYGEGICDLDVDDKGFVYVTGTSWVGPSYTDYDYLTIKYSQTSTGIELAYFNAKPKDNGILLNWTITGEDDNFAGFNLYRQEVPSLSNNPVSSNVTPDIISWEKVNTEPITGHNPYQYTDNYVSEGKTYEYRLEAVYKKSWGEFSETIGTTKTTYSGEKESFSIVSVYPNPASDIVHCVMNIPYSGQVRVEIYDISGRRVSENSFFAYNEGETEGNVDVSKLINGVYEIKAFLDNECARTRMVITR
jgi:hypothetical protein